MDCHFLCVVIRGTDACLYHVNLKSTVDELKSNVCSYWNNISPDSIQFVFDYEGRSNVVDSDVKLRYFLSLCIVKELSFLELRLFERVPLRAPDFVSEPTMSEFRLAPDPSRDHLVIPRHLSSNSKVTRTPTMTEFILGKGNSSDQSPIPSYQELVSSQDIHMSQE
ncbi:hypothetical protein MKW92_046371, partial [Papaver armeniacum]